MGKRGRLRLGDVLELMRVIREACELGEHPDRWRGHVLERLGEILDADDASAVCIELPESAGTVKGNSPAALDATMVGRSTPRHRIVSITQLPESSSVSVLAFTRDEDREPFGTRERRLLKIFHQELARLWVTPVLGVLPQALRDELSPRLREILAMLMRGVDEKRIAYDLGRSRHTIHNHVRILYRRLGVKSRAELLAVARPARDFRPRLV